MTNLITRTIVSLIIISLAIIMLVELPQATSIARMGQGYLLITFVMAGGAFVANKRWQILGLGFTGVLVPVLFLI